jgi:uncharacterized protein (PEP-CTERM system associated)
VRAETWRLDPAIEGRATWTDNAAFEDRATSRSDAIFELVPSLAVRGEGKRLRVNGTLSLTALTYANGTRDNRVLPTVDLNGHLEAVERVLFLDAGVVARQGAQDVFGPRPDGGANLNTVTTTQYHVSPSLEGKIAGDVNVRLRSDNSWTNVTGDQTDAGDAYLGQHVLKFERKPTPMGWRLEASRSDTRFKAEQQPSATIDSARLALEYALTSEAVLGVRGGYERTNLVVNNRTQTIYGASLNWQPTPRTVLEGQWEERFFGAGWRFRFDHRMPRLAWNVSASRDVLSFPQSFLTLPPTNNVSALLDAAFTTRFPDPAERGRVVSDLIARLGLPPSLATQTSVFTQQVSIVRSISAMITLVGVRNSIALSAFSNSTRALEDSIFTTVATVGPQNVLQEGVSLTFSHQLSTLSALNVTAEHLRTKGQGVDEGLETKQSSGRVQFTRQLAPRTSAFIGGRVQDFKSNVPGTTGAARERAGFVGLGHRF